MEMKIFTGFLLLIGAAAFASAQITPKAIAEISAGAEKVVKGAPFSAEAVSESVQTLADGNRIARKWTNKLYRNSEGRFRREGSGLPGSALGAYFSVEPSVSILDPVAGSRFMVDTESKTVRAITLARQGGKFEGQFTVIAPAATDAAKVQAELEAAKTVNGFAVVTAAPVVGVMPAIAGTPVSPGQRWESRSESLGTQDFEGVQADGTGTITTIPEGAIGNERPIEI